MPSGISTGSCATRTSSNGLPLAGDVAVFRFGRTFSHGAIVVEWPVVIHAYWAVGRVVWGDAARYPLAGRRGPFFGIIDD